MQQIMENRHCDVARAHNIYRRALNPSLSTVFFHWCYAMRILIALFESAGSVLYSVWRHDILYLCSNVYRLIYGVSLKKQHLYTVATPSTEPIV